MKESYSPIGKDIPHSSYQQLLYLAMEMGIPGFPGYHLCRMCLYKSKGHVSMIKMYVLQKYVWICNCHIGSQYVFLR